MRGVVLITRRMREELCTAFSRSQRRALSRWGQGVLVVPHTLGGRCRSFAGGILFAISLQFNWCRHQNRQASIVATTVTDMHMLRTPIMFLTAGHCWKCHMYDELVPNAFTILQVAYAVWTCL